MRVISILNKLWKIGEQHKDSNNDPWRGKTMKEDHNKLRESIIVNATEHFIDIKRNLSYLSHPGVLKLTQLIVIILTKGWKRRYSISRLLQ